jgi:hypothetical protein
MNASIAVRRYKKKCHVYGTEFEGKLIILYPVVEIKRYA